jgi:hypothetical protein
MKRFACLAYKPTLREKHKHLHFPVWVFRYFKDTITMVSVAYAHTGLKKSDLKDLILVIILIILMSARVVGQSPGKNICTAVHINNTPVIDGLLNDDAWQGGTWCGDFTQNEPFNNRPASQRTKFKIAYDDDNIYAAIKAFDTNPDSIVSRLSRRDQVEGDVVAIVFDSYHDLRTGFFFGVSAAGVKFDLVYTNDGKSQDPTWDPDWWVKTSLATDGWAAEIKIPLSQFRFDSNNPDIWGLQVARLIYRKNEIDYWQHIPKDAPGLIHMFGELTGIEKIRPRKIFDITPYALVKAETCKTDKENPFVSQGKCHGLNAGLDTKIGVTNNITLDLTINPDFGQVEADPSVVNLTAFETFYKEQRPFFVEGNNITDFNLGIGDDRVGNDNLFYSRRIGRAPQYYPGNIRDGWSVNMPGFTSILGAAKLTGKTKDGLSVGFLDAVTNKESSEIDTAGGKIYQPAEPLTNYFVGRVQQDINSGNTIIGGIVTATNRVMDSTLASVLHRSAYTGGFDFTQYFRNKSWMISLSSAVSIIDGTSEAIARTQESPAHYYQKPGNDYIRYDTRQKSLAGSGGRLEIKKLNGHLNVMGTFIWKTPGFETNDLGYLQQADQLLGILYASYNQWEPKWIYYRYSVSCDIYSLFDFGGDILARGIEPAANISFRNNWNAYFSGSLTTDQLSNTLLRGGPLMKIPGSYQVRSGVSTDNRRKLTFSVNYERSGKYQNSSGSAYLNFSIQYKPTNYLTFSLSPQTGASDDQLQYIETATYSNSPRYVFATIHQETVSVSLRANVNFSPDLSLQYWGQPFMATGKYSDYKYIADPLADSYNERFHIYSGNQIAGDNSGYAIDENEDGVSDYHIEANDFNYQAFLSNLVIRWEFDPGSSLYFVWSQSGNGNEDLGTMYCKYLGSLFRTKPANVFLLKFSYRFGLK